MNSIYHRDNLIDIAKFIASILVIAIHTGVFSETNMVAWQFDLIARLAVPFFVVCTGYYLGQRCELKAGKLLDNIQNRKLILGYIKKIAILYMIWSVIYLVISIPKWIETGWFSKAAFKDWIVAFGVRGSYYHLWYLLFLIYAVLFTYIIWKKISVRYFAFIITVLYTIEVLQYGYRMFLPATFVKLLAIYDILPCLSSITRLVPMLLIGIYISCEERESNRFYILGLVGSIIVVLVERNLLFMNGQDGVSYIFTTLPTSYFLFQVILGYKNILSSNSKIFSELSTIIYVSHPLLIEGLYTTLEANVVLFLITTVAAVTSGVVYLKCVKIKLKELKK